MALKTAPKDRLHHIIDLAKKYFITQLMSYDPE
jgi:hypothetical protein